MKSNKIILAAISGILMGASAYASDASSVNAEVAANALEVRAHAGCSGGCGGSSSSTSKKTTSSTKKTVTKKTTTTKKTSGRY